MPLSSASNGPDNINSSRTIIATHDGVFHADDVFAVAALKILYPNADVIRTRVPEALEAATYVVDVGGVYDSINGRYDHHQKGRAGARENGVLYSSFGLVWQHYGMQVAATVCDMTLSLAQEVKHAVDLALVCPIDAVDNGQELLTGGTATIEGVRPTSLSHVISSFNPTWQEPARDFYAAFLTAVEIAGQIIRREVHIALGRIAARDYVRRAISLSAGGPIVTLWQFVPWGEQVRDEAPDAKFVVFPSETGTWMVQAVGAKAGTFESRKLLPEAWAGLRDGDFQEVTGVSDGVFCHPGRFICGAASEASAMRLARMAVEA